MIKDISGEFDSEEQYLFTDDSIKSGPPTWLIQDMVKLMNANKNEKSNVILIETEEEKEKKKRKENRKLRKERFENGTLIDLEIKRAKDMLCYNNFGGEAKKSPRFKILINNSPSRPQTPRATNQSPRNISQNFPNPPDTTVYLNIIESRCDKLLEKVNHNKNIRLNLLKKEKEKQAELINSFKPVEIPPPFIDLNIDDSILAKADDIGKEYDPIIWGVRPLEIKEEIEIANQRMKTLLILTLYNVFLGKRFNFFNCIRKFKFKRVFLIIGRLIMKYIRKKRLSEYYKNLRIPINFIINIRKFRKIKATNTILWFIKNINSGQSSTILIAVKVFLKKIRYCQKIIRSFLLINRARVHLLLLFWKRNEKKWVKFYSNKVEKNDILSQQQLSERIMKDNKKLTHKKWEKTHAKVINLLSTAEQASSKFENAKLGWYYMVNFY